MLHMQPHFIRATIMKMMYYVLKSQQSKHRSIINTWTTSVQTLQWHGRNINVDDVSLKLQHDDTNYSHLYKNTDKNKKSF